MQKRTVKDWLHDAAINIPPKGLEGRIFAELSRQETAQTRIRLFSFGVASIATCYGLILALGVLQAELLQSGFVKFLSLIISDFSVVLVLWKEFLLSLAESFPALETATVLGGILLFIISLRLLIKTAIMPYKKSHWAIS